MQVLIQVELEFRNVGFSGERRENPQQTQPMYATGPESNPGHMGVLSPLRHPRSLKDSLKEAV